jgi:sterol desaturase/sphingolipid hydroxylase (fatty acid hydroxylase superfamily)
MIFIQMRIADKFILTTWGRMHAPTPRRQGIIMRMNKIGYFAEFLLFPPLVLVATFLAFSGSTPPQPFIWAIVYCIGLVGWTLIEYLLHRALFHHAPILTRMHERHHHSPQDLLGTPVWASVLIALIAVAVPLMATLGFGLGTAATGGMATGYLCYVFVHHTTHHWRPRRGSYLYRARLRHARHHHLSQAGNFGVTTDIWDRVFGTALDGYVPAPRAN